MGSSFSSLNAALTGLYAAQRLVEVSGHNIENMNTPGYTRQRISQKALGISSTPSIFSGSVPQGGGVEMERLQRCGDIFLDAKLRLETGRASKAKEIAGTWKNIESAMDELSPRSVTNTLTEFYKSWADVNNASDNNGARATVLGKAQAMVDQIAAGYTRVSDLWKNGRAQADALVADINTTMDSVMALNDRIRSEKANGADVNELIDQRAQLVLHLSDLTGATGREREDGTLEVMLAGNSMVGKNYVNHFVVAGSRDMPGIEAAPKATYKESLQALGGAAKLQETVQVPAGSGNNVPKYNFEVKTRPANHAQAGQSYGVFTELKADGTTVEVAGTDKSFKLADFGHDEGPVRITWSDGGHQVVLEEGRLGGLMNNLAPVGQPHVAGTVGTGGAFAETGQLYNDLAARMAKEVNTLHTTPGSRTLEPKSAQIVEINLANGKPTGTTWQPTPPLTRQDNETQTDFTNRVNKALEDKLRNHNDATKTWVYQVTMKEGGNVFNFASADNKLPPALRLSVAIDNPSMLAAGVESGGTYDGSIAYKLSKAQDNPDSAINEWSKSVVDVGVHTRGANDRANLAEQTRRIAERAHQSGTGVEMNEEVVNLIQGQHAYAGAARVMSTVNQMLDDLINLGRR